MLRHRLLLRPDAADAVLGLKAAARRPKDGAAPQVADAVALLLRLRRQQRNWGTAFT